MGDMELQALPHQKPGTGLSPLSFSLPPRSGGISKRALGERVNDRR